MVVAGHPALNRECFVKLDSSLKLRTCTVQLKNVKTSPILHRKRLTREEKILLLPKKNSKLTKVRSGRVTKKKKGKFQLKLSSFPERDRASPDSGVSSRPESPEDVDDKDVDDIDDDVEDVDDIDDDVEDVDDVMETVLPDSTTEDFLKSLDDEEEEEEEDEGVEEDWKEGAEEVWVHKRKEKKMKGSVVVPKMQAVPKSEYEVQRDKKIKEKEDMLRALKAQWQSFKASTKPKPKPREFNPNHIRRKSVFTGELRRSGRSLGEKVEYTELDESTLTKKVKNTSRHGYFDEEEFRYVQREKVKGTRSVEDPNTDVLRPEDVTEDMLSRIHQYGAKDYKAAEKTCCHQCRQKTADTKTVCRSGVCVGLRGQFCGTCLNNRYGESARDALLDPDWSCPPCRKICNCSFCLEVPTGQLYYLAREKGFASVHHYLMDLRKRWDQDQDQDQEEDEDQDSE